MGSRSLLFVKRLYGRFKAFKLGKHILGTVGVDWGVFPLFPHLKHFPHVIIAERGGRDVRHDIVYIADDGKSLEALSHGGCFYPP